MSGTGAGHTRAVQKKGSAQLIAALEASGRDVDPDAREEAKLRAGTDDAVRRALAEHYRRIRQPAQAGRWGIVFPGWGRPHEVAQLRLWLAGTADRGDYVRRSLSLAASTPLPHAVADLSDPALRERRPGARRETVAEVSGCVAAALLAAVALVPVFGIGKVIVDGLAGARSADGPVLVVTAAVLLGLALVFGLIRTVRPRLGLDPTFLQMRAAELMITRPREGRAMLRALVAVDDTDTARHALVDDARRRGRPAEAARWGCTIAGLTTAEERSAYADVLLSGSRPAYADDRLVDASRVPYDDPSAGDVDAVRALLGARPPRPAVDLPPPDGGPRVRFLLLALLSIPVGAGVIVWSDAAPRVIASLSLAFTAGMWTVLFAIAAVQHPRRPATGLVSTAIVSAIATGAAVVFAFV